MNKKRYLTLALFTFGVAAVTAAAVRRVEQAHTVGPSTTSAGAEISSLARSLRPNYPYSVIPGGAYTPTELRSAIVRDKNLREHYAGFDLDKLRLVKLLEDRFAYVSYRQNGRFYWTKRKLRILRGEILLTDGVHYAKTRCGNRLSDFPSEPTQVSDKTEAQLSPPPLALDGMSELTFLPSPGDPSGSSIPQRPSLEAAETAPPGLQDFAADAGRSSSRTLLPEEGPWQLLGDGTASGDLSFGEAAGWGASRDTPGAASYRPQALSTDGPAFLQIAPVAAVPEPSEALLVGVAFGLVLWKVRRIKAGGSQSPP